MLNVYHTKLPGSYEYLTLQSYRDRNYEDLPSYLTERIITVRSFDELFSYGLDFCNMEDMHNFMVEYLSKFDANGDIK